MTEIDLNIKSITMDLQDELKILVLENQQLRAKLEEIRSTTSCFCYTCSQLRNDGK